MHSHQLETVSRTTRVVTALLAASPWLLLQFAFITDAQGWSLLLFGYGIIVLFTVIAFFLLTIYCAVEIAIRWHSKVRYFPSFSVAAGILLLGFFLPAAAIKPTLQNNPRFCFATQTIEWETSRPNSDWDFNDCFIVVVNGRGTADNHDFESGHMNWSGDEPAGFPSINFHPISFQRTYHEYSNEVGTLDSLKSQMAKSGIPASELDPLSEDIWQVLTQIENGEEIQTRRGKVYGVDSSIQHSWDYVIGGWIWMGYVVLVFIVVGWFTMGPSAASSFHENDLAL